jgi:hypothetical protein
MLEKLKSGVEFLGARSLGVALAVAVMVSTLVVPEAAHAQTIDTTAVVTFLTDEVLPAIGAVMVVFLIIAATFAGYRWVRGAAGGN